MLAVSDGNAAMEFYRAAFGATVLWDLDGAVAGLAIDGAPFFLAHESPPHGTRGPASVGFTTVRIELFVDDPVGCNGKHWRQEPESTVPCASTSTRRRGRGRSDGCCKGRWWIRLGICG